MKYRLIVNGAVEDECEGSGAALTNLISQAAIWEDDTLSGIAVYEQDCEGVKEYGLYEEWPDQKEIVKAGGVVSFVFFSGTVATVAMFDPQTAIDFAEGLTMGDLKFVLKATKFYAKKAGLDMIRARRDFESGEKGWTVEKLERVVALQQAKIEQINSFRARFNNLATQLGFTLLPKDDKTIITDAD